jgi:1-acyl-sn-glycerol-3-phosphate acyltransferase
MLDSGEENDMMSSFPGRLWRALATGLGFVIFGFGCVVVMPTLLPLLLLWPGSELDRRRRVRGFVGMAFQGLLWLIACLGLGRVSAEGLENLRRSGGSLILASHPTFLDVVVLIALHPQADCVVKSALWRNPFTRLFVRAAGYISNDDPEALIDACVATVRAGGSLVLFPEGTRSKPGQPLRFKRGAARIAVQANSRIVPVLVACNPPTLTKGDKWYQVPERPWRLRIRALPDCCASDFLDSVDQPIPVRVRHLTEALQDYFQRELESYEHSY